MPLLSIGMRRKEVRLRRRDGRIAVMQPAAGAPAPHERLNGECHNLRSRRSRRSCALEEWNARSGPMIRMGDASI